VDRLPLFYKEVSLSLRRLISHISLSSITIFVLPDRLLKIEILFTIGKK